MAGLGRKIFTAGDVLTASDVQSYLQDQAVMVFAGTAARSSAIATPSEGMVAITTDTDELQYYNGSAWVAGIPFGAWQSYTPTFTNFSLGTGGGAGTITVAKYVQIGKTVHVKVNVTLGTSSTVTGRIGISLPVTGTTDYVNVQGVCKLSAGGVAATGVIAPSSATNMDLYALLASGTYVTNQNTSSAVPGTWASGSSFSFFTAYEAA
jgi:hypothetical protein